MISKKVLIVIPYFGKLPQLFRDVVAKRPIQ